MSLTDALNVSSHLELDPVTAEMKVIEPFIETGKFSVNIVVSYLSFIFFQYGCRGNFISCTSVSLAFYFCAFYVASGHPTSRIRTNKLKLKSNSTSDKFPLWMTGKHTNISEVQLCLLFRNVLEYVTQWVNGCRLKLTEIKLSLSAPFLIIISFIFDLND